MKMISRYKITDFSKNIIIILAFILSTNLLITLYIGVTNNQLDLNLSGMVDYFKKKVVVATSKVQANTGTAAEYFQQTPYTCGPAALRYLLYYSSLQIEISEAELAEKMGMTRDGTTLASMVTVLDELGLQGIASQVNYEMLKKMPKPLLAYINNERSLVIVKIEDDLIYLFDPNPNYGYMVAKKDQFLQIWQGSVLELTTQELSYGGG